MTLGTMYTGSCFLLANVYSSPNLHDKFAVRYTNTFMSVFPHATRQVLALNFDAWAGTQEPSRPTSPM